jgi:hypothetical protein
MFSGQLAIGSRKEALKKTHNLKPSAFRGCKNYSFYLQKTLSQSTRKKGRHGVMAMPKKTHRSPMRKKKFLTSEEWFISSKRLSGNLSPHLPKAEEDKFPEAS